MTNYTFKIIIDQLTAPELTAEDLLIAELLRDLEIAVEPEHPIFKEMDGDWTLCQYLDWQTELDFEAQMEFAIAQATQTPVHILRSELI